MPPPAAITTRPPTSGFLDQALGRTSRDEGRQVQGRGFQAKSACAEHSHGGCRHYKHELTHLAHSRFAGLTTQLPSDLPRVPRCVDTSMAANLQFCKHRGREQSRVSSSHVRVSFERYRSDRLWPQPDVMAAVSCGAMHITSEPLIVGRCYRTAKAEVFKIVSFDGSRVIYVVERNGICPAWNKAAWRTMSKVDFAKQVDREVLCR